MCVRENVCIDLLPAIVPFSTPILGAADPSMAIHNDHETRENDELATSTFTHTPTLTHVRCCQACPSIADSPSSHSLHFRARYSLVTPVRQPYLIVGRDQQPCTLSIHPPSHSLDNDMTRHKWNRESQKARMNTYWSIGSTSWQTKWMESIVMT